MRLQRARVVLLAALLCGASASAADGDRPPTVAVVPAVAWPAGVPTDAVAVLLVDVGPDGRVTGARVLRTTHRALADAALALVSQVRFDPAVSEGVPAPGTATWTVRHDLVTDDAIEVIDRAPWRVRDAAPFDADAPAVAWTFSGGDIERVAGGAGDTAHALQAIPGVAAYDLRSTALSIRAGEPSDTVWVVDGVPLLGPRSAGTLLSRVPALLIDEVVVHGGAPPIALPGSGSGLVDVRLVEPDDTEVDGVAEVSTGVIQAQVSAPIGVRGAGNAVQVSLRRSLLEPGLAALQQVGIAEGWLLRVEDAALRLRLRPAAAHEVRVTGLLGHTRVRDGAEATGLERLAVDDTSTALVVARHAWQATDTTEVEHQIAWTREVQDVVNGDADHRRDVRSRLAWRGWISGRVGPQQRLQAGAEVGATAFAGSGVIQDPRTAPVGVRVPWRAMGPPTVDLDSDATWTDGGAWVEHTLDADRVHTSAAVRATLWSGQVLLSPRVSVGGRLGSATQVAASASRVPQLPRDPIGLDSSVGVAPLAATETTQISLMVQQGVGEHVLVRVDGWARSQERVPVWSDSRSELSGGRRSEAVGQARTTGFDASVGLRTDRIRGLVSASLADGRLTNPLAAIGPTRVRPWWVVPWSTTVQGGVTLGRRQPWHVGGRVRVRAGVDQVPLDWVVELDELRIVADLDRRTRLAPTWQAAARVERSGVVAGRVELSVYGDLVVTGGPLAAVLRGGSVDPDTGDVTPPTPVVIRDVPLVPWLGARARW